MFIHDILNIEGNYILPLEVELELYAWVDITRNILVVLFLSAVMYYAWSRSTSDEKWVERRFASFLTLTLFVWSILTVLIPFTILSFAHPDLIIEIGE